MRLAKQANVLTLILQPTAAIKMFNIEARLMHVLSEKYLHMNIQIIIYTQYKSHNYATQNPGSENRPLQKSIKRLTSLYEIKL